MQILKGVESPKVAIGQLLDSVVILISPRCGSLPEDSGSRRESCIQKLSGYRAGDLLNVPANEMEGSRDRVTTRGYAEEYSIPVTIWQPSDNQTNRRIEIMLSDAHGYII
ncbi:MAG: hypothetical protein Q8O64_16285 [Sideroxyarcus sp.]|nr:hypothetical protein [Sideroxyarcus sp.]